MASRAGPVYAARYGRTTKHIIGIGFGVVMSAVILLIPAPAWARVLVVVTLGGSSIMLAAITLSRTPAIRVDAAGVTIRPYTMPFSVTAFYPWEDVAQIMISKHRFVHLQLREGAQLSALNRLTSPQAREALTAGRPAGNLRSYPDPPGITLLVNGWTLHPARLAAAATRFAPAVQVIDVATRSAVQPSQT